MDATGISDFPFSSLFLQDLCQKIDPTGSDWLLLFFCFEYYVCCCVDLWSFNLMWFETFSVWTSL
jgi:hypothetical protein